MLRLSRQRPRNVRTGPLPLPSPPPVLTNPPLASSKRNHLSSKSPCPRNATSPHRTPSSPRAKLVPRRLQHLAHLPHPRRLLRHLSRLRHALPHGATNVLGCHQRGLVFPLRMYTRWWRCKASPRASISVCRKVLVHRVSRLTACSSILYGQAYPGESKHSRTACGT